MQLPGFGAGMIIASGSKLSRQRRFGHLMLETARRDRRRGDAKRLRGVDDADAICTASEAASARIAMEIKDEDYGGRGFSCYDLEATCGTKHRSVVMSDRTDRQCDRIKARTVPWTARTSMIG